MRLGSKRWHRARRRRKRVQRPFIGSAYRGRDWRGEGESLYCTLCQTEVEWEPCYLCGGDGYFDGYEEDPLWYDPGDEVPCAECNGKGGFNYCETKDCPTVMVRRVFKIKPLLK